VGMSPSGMTTLGLQDSDTSRKIEAGHSSGTGTAISGPSIDRAADPQSPTFSRNESSAFSSEAKSAGRAAGLQSQAFARNGTSAFSSEAESAESLESIANTFDLLKAAKHGGRVMRLRISGTCVIVGCTLFVVGMWLYLSHEFPWWSGQLGDSLWHWGLTALALAVLPTDRKLVYFAMSVWVLALMLVGLGLLTWEEDNSVAVFKKLCEPFDDDSTAWLIGLFACKTALAIICFGAAFALARAALVLYPRDLLASFWNILFWYMAMMACGALLKCGMALALEPPRPPNSTDPRAWLSSLCWVPNEVVMTLVLSIPSFRRRMQAMLASRGESVRTAAAISSLLSSGDAQKGLVKACGLFRAVSCDQLREGMLASNGPDPALFSLSQAASLGAVDAFLSHSWHDDPPAKWAALQVWREQFKAEHGGREPLLWLDKVCLDQTNIEESLQCLPVFLSGCNQLLVLAGKTYLTRLWCIVEVFVFLAIEGKSENLTIRSLVDASDGHGSLRELVEQFDSSKVTCARPEDKDRLLGFVEAGFGDLTTFSQEVQRELMKACWTEHWESAV